MASFTLTNPSPLFRLSVEKLLENWSALQLAVVHGQGGAYGKDIAVWMRGAVEEFFYQNDDLAPEEVADFVSEIMNNEMDTIVEDNTLEELSLALCNHFQLARNPSKDGDLRALHSALDALKTTSTLPKVEVAGDISSSDDDEEQDEEMETDDQAQSSSSMQSNQRAGHNFVSQPDEDGWVTVVKSKKK